MKIDKDFKTQNMNRCDKCPIYKYCLSLKEDKCCLIRVIEIIRIQYTKPKKVRYDMGDKI